MPNAHLLCPPTPPPPTLLEAWRDQSWLILAVLAIYTGFALLIWRGTRRWMARIHVADIPWTLWSKILVGVGGTIEAIAMIINGFVTLPLAQSYAVWVHRAFAIIESCQTSDDKVEALFLSHQQNLDTLNRFFFQMMGIAAAFALLSLYVQRRARAAAPESSREAH
ncbi:MAG TPA: hypothetical protein VHI51_03355 [Ktedonobacterales bacterium]|nr:hypothetical protein [Ktedonobacterales bacterium]